MSNKNRFEGWVKHVHEKDNDSGIGYWIGDCPPNCRKFYAEFIAGPFLDTSKRNKVFLYGYLDKKGSYQGNITTFYEDKNICYKGCYKDGKLFGLGVSFNRNGSIECFIDYNGKTVSVEEGKKYLAKNRLKSL